MNIQRSQIWILLLATVGLLGLSANEKPTTSACGSSPTFLKIVENLSVPEHPVSLDPVDQNAYLMSYFKDETHSLHFATSLDGFTFIDVNNGDPVLLAKTWRSKKAYGIHTS